MYYICNPTSFTRKTLGKVFIIWKTLSLESRVLNIIQTADKKTEDTYNIFNFYCEEKAYHNRNHQ